MKKTKKPLINQLLSFLTYFGPDKFSVDLELGLIDFDEGDWYFNEEPIGLDELALEIGVEYTNAFVKKTYEYVTDAIIEGYLAIEAANEFLGKGKVELIITEHIKFRNRILEEINKALKKQTLKVIK